MAKLDEKITAWTFVIFTFLIFDLPAWVWHGLLGQPSILPLLYPGFWQNTYLMAMALAGSLAYAYIAGVVVAKSWNWVSKNKKRLW